MRQRGGRWGVPDDGMWCNQWSELSNPRYVAEPPNPGLASPLLHAGKPQCTPNGSWGKRPIPADIPAQERLNYRGSEKC